MSSNQLFNGQQRISNIAFQRSRDTIYNILQRALPPSALYNYTKNDSCIDYLELNGLKYGYQPNQESDSNKLLKCSGLQFEEQVFHKIKEKCQEYNLECVELSLAHNISFYDRYMETQSLLDRGVDVIIHGGVADLSNEFSGIPDLILRTDTTGILFTNDPFEIEDNSRYYYTACDIKLSKIRFQSNNDCITNSGNFPYYKIQSWVYNLCLSRMTGFLSSKSYLLGNGYSYSNNREVYNDPFYTLGIVDPEEKIGFNGETVEQLMFGGFDFIRKLRSSVLYDKPIEEIIQFDVRLAPNMNNNYNGKWSEAKKQIALKTGELTLLYKLKTKDRNKLVLQGIKSWRNPNLTTDSLDLNIYNKNSVTAQIVDTMMNINRYENQPNISVRRITNPDIINIINPEVPIKFYLDFETANLNGETIIFQIGVIVADIHNDKYQYTSFVANRLDWESELRIMNNYLDFMNQMKSKYRLGECRTYFWSNAERNFMNKFVKKLTNHPQTRSVSLTLDNAKQVVQGYQDLSWVFKNNPIVVKGVFGYGLKPITKALHNCGLIKCEWGNGLDGLSASLFAIETNKRCIRENTSFSDTEIAQEIVKYNEVDCRAIYEIHKLLLRFV